MDTAEKVIELLYDRREGWWLMHELGSAADAGTAELDRAMGELGRRGQRLEYSPATGVRLCRPPALDAHLIERDLPVKRVGRHAICFPVVDSTNETAADSARQEHADGLAVLAEAQRAGRGRHGRRWLSPPGANILMSVVLVDPAGLLPLEAATIATGLAVAEGVEAAFEPSRRPACSLKWPNDVLLEGMKLAGVLVEQRRRAGKRVVVIGIGINVNASPPESDIGYAATSLSARLGEETDRIPVIRGVLVKLDEWIGGILSDQASAIKRIRTGWERRCGMIDQRHTIASHGRRHTGRVMEIDPLEGLTLLTDAGTQVRIAAEGASVL